MLVNNFRIKKSSTKFKNEKKFLIKLKINKKINF